jgi:nifR3 family TIM-barrel protein
MTSAALLDYRQQTDLPGRQEFPFLYEPWQIEDVTIPNRVVLAPLAGIGNWFVRLQAKRFGAGLAISEMVSSFAIHYKNEKTCVELLKIHPDEFTGGPVAIQLFGQDPEVMRSAAAVAAERGPDIIDLNMGCPVPKVCKTGAGAGLLKDHDTAIKVAIAAREGSGLPVTVKLRAGQRPGEQEGVVLARRLVEEAGVSAITFHPRSAMVRHKGTPDYELAKEVVETLPVPVIISGGMNEPEHIRTVLQETGAAAVMLARGAMGNPWLFAQVLGSIDQPPTEDEIFTELEWTVNCAVEHFGDERAARYLRKFYPWYLEPFLPSNKVNIAIAETETTSTQLSILRSLLEAGPQ